MSRTAKIWLIVAACLVVLGPIIIAGAAAAGGMSFTENKEEFKTNSYEIGSTFDQIAVDTATTDITIATADEKQCKVVCTEPKNITHDVQVQDGKLIISSADARKWYEHIFAFSFVNPKVTIYLPEEEYSSLQIDTHTGDVVIPEGFTFDTLTVSGDTSDVTCASVSNDLSVKLSTGNVRIASPVADNIDIVTSTGDISFYSVASQGSVSVSTDTGDITLTDTLADGSFQIKSSTGNVKFEGCDAAAITVKTSTGDVTGTLLTDKLFVIQTSTGDVNVPKTTSGGKCEITTSTGDIRIGITSK